MTQLHEHRESGFTLIEAIVAIVVLGIVAGIVAIFMRGPIQGFVDSTRRAELTDAADLALRRMGRDLRLALPNSLRAVPNGFEFIITSGAGRYRDVGDGSTGGNVLSFTSAASTDFDVLGQMPTLATGASGDFIVVYNLGPGNEPGNAYDCSLTPPGCNIAQVASLPGPNTVRLASNVFANQTPPKPGPGSSRCTRRSCAAGPASGAARARRGSRWR